jgi:hypothetical protein
MSAKVLQISEILEHARQERKLRRQVEKVLYREGKSYDEYEANHTAQQRLKEEISLKRKEARKKLAKELKSARTKLRSLKYVAIQAEHDVEIQINKRAREIRQEWATRLKSAKERLRRLKIECSRTSNRWKAKAQPVIDEARASRLYPDIPAPTIAPTRQAYGLPDSPGIYFLWKGDAIEYVGKSICLSRRLILGNHHVLNADHLISFLFMDSKELNWAECFYIGLVRPKLNFGQNTSHYTDNDR